MSDNLNRYYTEKQISSLLVSSFSYKEPSRILDIGAGRGSLIIEAYKRWCNARFFATDIDTVPLNKLKNFLPKVQVSKVDGLCPDLDRKLQLSFGPVDIAVCNPPYRKIKNTGIYDIILKKAGFNRVIQSFRLTTDIVFLAQNLNMLKQGGELGIILPDTLLSGSGFEKFRTDLLENTTVSSIIQLPDNIFAKTEASTHILILKKKISDQKYEVPLRLADNEGGIIGEVTSSSESLLHRMDYNFHSFTTSKNEKTKTLGDIGAAIFRGKHSKKELVELLGERKFFHLSSFDNDSGPKTIKFNNQKVLSSFAKKGDILIARVGKRNVGQLAFVESGEVEISDCVLVIRVDKKYQKPVFQSLVSENGKAWIKAYAHGVCSRFITQKDLVNFPLSFSK